MRAELSDMLDGYCIVGCGRGKNYSGESAAVAYKKGKFELLALDNFWLSTTPHVPGSRYGADQSSCPRITTALLLTQKDDVCPFWFVNTHLDHVGKTARFLSSVQLMQFISEHTEPCILTGDFNEGPSAQEIRILLENEQIGLVDCTSSINGTFHDFGKMMDNMSKIDYIFTNLPCDERKTYVCADEAPNGTYYSDHLAVCAYVEVK
jgi:endonuclease/exonuclease/phosphatase family metal-dependent hydrolase